VLAETLGLGFIIGLTGAIPPGPMLVVVINGSLKHGWKAGPLAVLGHVVVETGILAVIAMGVYSIVEAQYITKPIGMVGGFVLILFGALTISNLRHTQSIGESKLSTRSKLSTISAGALSSMSNPYFWLWWFTVGAMLVVSTTVYGILGAVLFIAGHWAADITWFAFVSISMQQGKKFLSPNMIRLVLVSCSLFMIAFGAWFFMDAVLPSPAV